MADREKVITLLDDMRLFVDLTVHSIVSPDNWNVYSELCDFIDLTKEAALSLLEAQEPKFVSDIAEAIIGCKPKVKVGHCPSCGVLMSETDRYCRKCGQAVKWE